MRNPGIVVCSRLDSERLPNKVTRKLNGIPILVHLLRQLIKADMQVVVAVPFTQLQTYKELIAPFPELAGVFLFGSEFVKDPLARTQQVREAFNFSHVFRVTHDKIFVDIEAMKEVRKDSKLAKADYVYSPHLTPGTGFEVLSAKCLMKACDEFKDVEHLTYAARLVSEKTLMYRPARPIQPYNLLIDFPEDMKLMEVLLSQVGNDSNLEEVFEYLSNHSELAMINEPPLVTVYTCAFNAEKFLEEAMESVLLQSNFREMEYILIDDHSTDRTTELMARFAINRPNVTWYRNEKNIGLASSSNFALKRARGKYLVRLDADDCFTDPRSIMGMVEQAEKTNQEIIYPDNFFGSRDTIQKGKERHHVGGSLFDRKALNFVKFTDHLRHYEGLDLFVRARNHLRIGYYDKPVFFYTQHASSMSKNNLEERAKIKAQIEAGA
jgi:spore coat polysaccharide biosynthesis protein SpsF (cytidylyltransferase family)